MARRARVSVCMAVLNGARHLVQQLTTILEQLDDADEVIIVNDGSTDSTGSQVEALHDSRVRVIGNANSRGPMRAFEAALREAQGEYIFFADHDDIWLPGKVEHVLRAFARTGALAVVTDARVIRGDGEIVLDSYFAWRRSGPGLVKNFYRNTFLGCCMAIRTECKGFLLPIPALAVMHDVWSGLACEIVGDTYFLQQPLVHYRRHDSNHSRMQRYSWPRILARRMKLAIALIQATPRLLIWRSRYRGLRKVQGVDVTQGER